MAANGPLVLFPKERRTSSRPLWIDPRVRRVEGLMHHQVHQKLRLRELAQGAALSVWRLSHLFRSQTGVPPARYLKLVRLEEARVLLESSNLNVKEIAAKVGFDDVSRFIEEFRKAYGVTPRRYRLRFLQGGPVPQQESSKIGI